MPHSDMTNDDHESNPGYAAFQIARALVTCEQHEDAATRERARVKVGKWMCVLEGMLSGQLTVGSRQPMADLPVWVTPEVVTGGFATGRLLAGGELQSHEIKLAGRIGTDSTGGNRQTLNAWFLTEAGLGELAERLRSGLYDIQVPEEAAMLVVAWLAMNDKAEEARELVDTVSPQFARLRFYPGPAEQPMTHGSRIFLESVETVMERLRRIHPHSRILAQREAIQVWTPLYQQMVELFLETVAGDMPTIQPDREGRWTSPETRRFNVVGGWPCRNFVADWGVRAHAIVVSIEQAQVTHRLCGRPGKGKDSFALLLGFLRKCCDDPNSLTGRDVGMIRLILARHIARCGAPDSQRRAAIQARQEEQVAKPMHDQIASVVNLRLAKYPANAGLDDVAEVLRSVTAEEAASRSIAAGTAVPPSIALKVERSLCDTADVLIDRGIVTSGETLARVIPQFTASLRATAFDDPQLRVLYAATYRAFRRRRSLLLLNLAKQVRIEELPWVAAMERYRRTDMTTRDLSRQTLKDVASLTLRAFPHAIIPNKLLQEFRALARGGELDLPFVEELAADIFMDNFSPKFTQAAKHAAAFVDGTLYARYYYIDCAAVLRLADAKAVAAPLSWFKREAPTNPFAALCIQRAAAVEGNRWDVARNGMIIEQSQVLTTHNLAVLLGALGLESELRDCLRGMAEHCFEWICRRQQVKSTKGHAKLIMLKQTAYAWRQMVLYVSRLTHEEAGEFLRWAKEHLSAQPGEFSDRFSPVLHGLDTVHKGEPLSSHAPRFLGWTQSRHWLLAKEV